VLPNLSPREGQRPLPGSCVLKGQAVEEVGFQLIMSGAWRHDLIPILSLTGVILDALGGLYLARLCSLLPLELAKLG
jgi:hypothetical protein